MQRKPNPPQRHADTCACSRAQGVVERCRNWGMGSHPKKAAQGQGTSHTHTHARARTRASTPRPRTCAHEHHPV